MSLLRSIGGRLLLSVLALSGLLGILGQTATTAAATTRYTYDVPTDARVGVHGLRAADANPAQLSVAREGSDSPSIETRSTSTTSSRSVVATEAAGAPKVTESLIRDAMEGAPLQTQQGAVSLPRVQDYVDELVGGSPAPAIKVDGSIIVDGNHRYVAGRIVGQEPAIQPSLGGRPDRVIPWGKQIVDPTRW